MKEFPANSLPEKSLENPAGMGFEEVNDARVFFRSLEIPLDQDGLISQELTEQQIDILAKYNEGTTTESGIIMSTEQDFYRKVLLAVSLWRQKEHENIAYLLGKGTGVEVVLRGIVSNRIRQHIKFPYRSHSDFELYAVNYEAGPNGENLTNTPIYPENFKKVFGGQEYFPPTKTKGLCNIPSNLLKDTAETVNLGEVSIFVPQLELLFLDKYIAQESTPRPEGIDAELLARQYVLDREKVHRYADQLVIEPMVTEIKLRTQRHYDGQISGIKRNLVSLRQEAVEKDTEINFKELVARLNKLMQKRIASGDPARPVSYSGIRSDLWSDLTSEQVDEDGNVIDQVFLQGLRDKLKVQEDEALESGGKIHERIDSLFDSIEKDLSVSEFHE